MNIPQHIIEHAALGLLPPGGSTFTWATKPAAATYTNQLVRVSNVGINGSWWYSDGVNWIPVGPITVYKSGLLIGIAGSGSIGNNGALTLTTALSTTYSGGLYLYFPANAISAGSAAGFYWTVMSSTTAGTVFNNVYTPGSNPVRPASNTAFSTTGPGAYTGSTAEITAISTTIPANCMVVTSVLGINNNSAGSKNYRIRFGATIHYGVANTANTMYYIPRHMIVNQYMTNAQAGSGSSPSGPSATVMVFSAVDTAADVTLAITLQLGTATDWVILPMAVLELQPGY
jgi:hypothetical protein